MFAALARLSPPARALLSSPLFGPWRGLKGMVRKTPIGKLRTRHYRGMWKGWPRFSPDGWPYARYMKKSRGENYVSKQEGARIRGDIEGTMALDLQAQMRAVPAFTVSGR